MQDLRVTAVRVVTNAMLARILLAFIHVFFACGALEAQCACAFVCVVDAGAFCAITAGL